MQTLFTKKKKNGEKSNVIHKSVKTYLKHYFGSEELLALYLIVW